MMRGGGGGANVGGPGNVEHLLRFGYCLMSIALLLMIWSSLARAVSHDHKQQIELLQHPPCSFNPLCTCSKPAPDLGIMQCRNVPFPAIPMSVNVSKVFALHMENTGLRELEPYFFQATGLYRLEISDNLLTDIPDDSFVGLERSLWELQLQQNELIEVPSRALRHLQKLRLLDLSGNYITNIEQDSFRGLEDALHTLILSRNLLSKLPPDSFSTLPHLDTIDLSGNNLAVIDANIFRDGMLRLQKLILSDNILTEIPYIPIAPLKQLRFLDISHNLITHFIEPPYNYDMDQSNGSVEIHHPSPSAKAQMNLPPVHLTLDVLHIEYNRIKQLPTNSFQNFDEVNMTYLDGNPLQTIGDEAFRPTKIRELYIRHCALSHVSPLAFEGLGPSLQILDLSGNNISNLSENTFHKFDVIRTLNLRDNKLKAPLLHSEMFNDFQFTLLKLDLSGEVNAPTNLQDLRRLRNLRSLSISRLATTSLNADDFLEFGLELEDLRITRSSVEKIKAHAFKYVRGIKRLDLSENHINQFESNAFREVGHSLLSLRMSHALASKMSQLPPDVMQDLTSLQELDASNNYLKTLSDTCFHFLRNLRVLEMHDNQLDQVVKGTFQGDIHTKLEVISLGFNHIKHIAQHTFVDLEALQRLHLEDNRIESVERRAFMNLDQLRHLSLRGNKLTSISDEAFQIYHNDPLPQHICVPCLQQVNDTYTKFVAFRRLQVQRTQLLAENTDGHSYLLISRHGQKERQLIQRPKSLGPPSPSPSPSESILAKILRNQHVYRVKSLQRICVDFFNDNGESLLDNVLYVEDNETYGEADGPEDEDDDDPSYTEHLDEDEAELESLLHANNKPARAKPSHREDDDEEQEEEEEDEDEDEEDEEPKLTLVATNITSNIAKTSSKKTKKRKPVNREYMRRKRRRPMAKGGTQHTASTASAAPIAGIHHSSAFPEDSETQDSCSTSLADGHETPTVQLTSKTRSQAVTNEPIVRRTSDRQSRPPKKLVMSSYKRIRKSNSAETMSDNSSTTASPIPPRLLAPSPSISQAPAHSPAPQSPHISDTTSSCSSAPATASAAHSKPAKQQQVFKKPAKSATPVPIMRQRQRSNTRINYSEELIDEALAYEEMLIDEHVQEQQAISSVLTKSRKLSAAGVGKPPKPTATAGSPSHPVNRLVKREPHAAEMVQLKPKMRGAFEQVSAEALTRKLLTNPALSIVTKTEPKSPPMVAGCSSNGAGGSGVSDRKHSKPAVIALAQQQQQPPARFNCSVNYIKEKLNNNPDSVLNINSAVSIQLMSTPRPPPHQSTKSAAAAAGHLKCPHCPHGAPNLAALAMHQVQHLRIATHRIGTRLVLDAALRRGRMVSAGVHKYFRCLNCWRLHPSSQSILEHWVEARCLFYCSICGESFHENPKLIRDHFPAVHGIVYKLSDSNRRMASVTKSATVSAVGRSAPLATAGGPERSPSPPPLQRPALLSRPKQQAKKSTAQRAIPARVHVSGRVTCEICNCSFPNMQSRNSHMRLHKKEALWARNGLQVPLSVKRAKQQQQQPQQHQHQQQHHHHHQHPQPNRQHDGGGGSGAPHRQQRQLSGHLAQLQHRQQLKQSQLQQLLQQKPKPFNFTKQRQAAKGQSAEARRTAGSQGQQFGGGGASGSGNRRAGGGSNAHSSRTAMMVPIDIDAVQIKTEPMAGDAGDCDTPEPEEIDAQFSEFISSIGIPECALGVGPSVEEQLIAFGANAELDLAAVKSEPEDVPRIQLKPLNALQSVQQPDQQQQQLRHQPPAAVDDIDSFFGTLTSGQQQSANQQQQQQHQQQAQQQQQLTASMQMPHLVPITQHTVNRMGTSTATAFVPIHPAIVDNGAAAASVSGSHLMQQVTNVSQQQQQLQLQTHQHQQPQVLHSGSGCDMMLDQQLMQQQQQQHQQQQLQQQHVQQFQISQVQQMQNSQYYNPVFVVQQPPMSIHQQQQPQMQLHPHQQQQHLQQPPQPHPMQLQDQSAAPDLYHHQYSGDMTYSTDFNKYYS